MFFGCASIKQPTGGPRDSIPPKVISETPKNLSTNFKAEKIKIIFDEFVKLTNEFQEVSISPSIDQLPEFKAKKETLEIKLPDSLEKNTTYTINFGNAIVDVNESNVLKNYSYVFSTGPVIDSLSISGSVINSVTKEKVKDATVFIIPVSQDSIFGKKRANIFTSTDSSGSFSLKNLREDTYRIYALNEVGGGDRIYNSTNEEIGFIKDSIHLIKDTSAINLQVFKEVPDKFKVVDRKLEKDGRLTLAFNKPLDNAQITVLIPEELNSQKTVELTTKKDSALVWFPEVSFDSIQVSISNDKQPLDTILLRRNKRDTYSTDILFSDNLYSNKVAPGTGIILTTSVPISKEDLSKIILLEDSIPVKKPLTIKKIENSNNRKYNLQYPWKQKANYVLKIEKEAFTGITGAKSVYYTKKFTPESEDNFGTLQMAYTLADTSGNFVVELLNEDNVTIQSDVITENKTIVYKQIPTGKYKIRVIYDNNKNGKWDSGSIKQQLQPEEIYNYNKEIMLRPNWELEEKMTIPKKPDQ